MALYVATNINSLRAQRALANHTQQLNTCYQRLASGLRINSAKDDAAGLQISNRLTAQINGLIQGNRNANDGIALLQTMEGALDETTNMLQRIRTLAVQAATGTNTSEDRQAIQEEVTALCEEITRIAQKTTFAGATVLNDESDNSLTRDIIDPATGAVTGQELFFQVGANAYDTLTFQLHGFAMSHIMEQVMGQLHDSTDGALQATNDATSLLCAGLLVEADPNNAGKFRNVCWSVETACSAQATLNNIDTFIQYVDSARARFGAMQNRMEAIIRNQSSIMENEADARSRIRDTDFAAETANLTQLNILQQASQMVLAQANQTPQIALNLLGSMGV